MRVSVPRSRFAAGNTLSRWDSRRAVGRKVETPSRAATAKYIRDLEISSGERILHW